MPRSMRFRAMSMPGVVALLILPALASTAAAQGYSTFQRQSAAIAQNANAGTAQSLNRIQREINRDNAGSRSIEQNYIRQNYPRLVRQYYASGASRMMPFQVFAHRELMSHATIAPPSMAPMGRSAANQAQIDRFNRMQAGHTAQVQAGDTLIGSGRRAGDANTATVDQAAHGMRGETAYANPATGGQQYMRTNAPGWSQAPDGTHYFQDQNGHYYQQQGSSMVPMDPARR